MISNLEFGMEIFHFAIRNSHFEIEKDIEHGLTQMITDFLAGKKKTGPCEGKDPAEKWGR